MEGPREGCRCWKRPVTEAFENYLRVAPIRSGDSVIVKMKWLPKPVPKARFLESALITKRVEPRTYKKRDRPSLAVTKGCGGRIFCCPPCSFCLRLWARLLRKEKKEYDYHIERRFKERIRPEHVRLPDRPGHQRRTCPCSLRGRSGRRSGGFKDCGRQRLLLKHPDSQ